MGSVVTRTLSRVTPMWRLLPTGCEQRILGHFEEFYSAGATRCTWRVTFRVEEYAKFQFNSVQFDKLFNIHNVLRGCTRRPAERGVFTPHQNCPLEIEDERKCSGRLVSDDRSRNSPSPGRQRGPQDWHFDGMRNTGLYARTGVSLVRFWRNYRVLWTISP